MTGNVMAILTPDLDFFFNWQYFTYYFGHSMLLLSIIFTLACLTHNINFNIFEKFVKQMNGLKTNLTSQKDFLTKLGIKERAEIISKNKNFTKKSDIYYRLERLINKKQMGHLFKVMLIKNKNNKFKLGF